jgi:hypothetical protein
MKTVMQKLVDTMNEDQVSFTEWFQDNFKLLIENEKEQIIDAYCNGYQDGSTLEIIQSEEYYNQTYNQNK